MFDAPQPRFRIYTTLASYRMVFADLFHSAQDNSSIEMLEQDICRRIGVRYALCMPTARTGLYATLVSLIRPGQKVLLSPLTIVDVINMVIAAGGIPFFIDVEKNTCNISAAEVERHIDRQTGAVLVTHLHGLACDIKRIRDLCQTFGVPLIEDAAQSFSTQVDGQWTGTFGRAGIFSFGMYKVVNAFYGGMVVTNDESLYADLKRRRDIWPPMSHSMLARKVLFALATDISTWPLPFGLFTYWFFRYGYLHHIEAIQSLVTVDRHPVRRDVIRPELLCRMRPGQARLILRQLDGVQQHNAVRISTAGRYHESFQTIAALILPPHRTDGSHIYTYYAMRVPDRHAFMRFALHKHRDLVLSHYHNCASLDIFKDFYRACPEAQATSDQLIYLPTYPRYSTAHIDRTIAVTLDYFKRASNKSSA